MTAATARTKHAQRCIQIENVKNLKENIDAIKASQHTLQIILQGNGDGKGGMVTDVALICKTIETIEGKLSVTAEVNTELEIQRRVAIEIAKAKQALSDGAQKRKLSTMQLIGLVFAGLVFVSSLVFNVLNYTVKIKSNAANITTTK
jgi:hypothetical protein